LHRRVFFSYGLHPPGSLLEPRNSKSGIWWICSNKDDDRSCKEKRECLDAGYTGEADYLYGLRWWYSPLYHHRPLSTRPRSEASFRIGAGDRATTNRWSCPLDRSRCCAAPHSRSCAFLHALAVDQGTDTSHRQESSSRLRVCRRFCLCRLVQKGTPPHHFCQAGGVSRCIASHLLSSSRC
jgi:hypothetical protein